jgi:hypothetical protein
MMYRMKDPTLAVVDTDGKRIMVTIPAGSLVVAEDQQLNQFQMVAVECEGARVLMFAQDLQSRGEIVNSRAA